MLVVFAAFLLECSVILQEKGLHLRSDPPPQQMRDLRVSQCSIGRLASQRGLGFSASYLQGVLGCDAEDSRSSNANSKNKSNWVAILGGGVFSSSEHS